MIQTNEEPEWTCEIEGVRAKINATGLWLQIIGEETDAVAFMTHPKELRLPEYPAYFGWMEFLLRISKSISDLGITQMKSQIHEYIQKHHQAVSLHPRES